MTVASSLRGIQTSASLTDDLALLGVLATQAKIPIMTIESYPVAGSATGITIVQAPSVDTNSNSLYGWSEINVTNLTQANTVQINLLYTIALPAKTSMHFWITNVAGTPIFWDSDTYQYPAYNGFKMHTAGGLPATGTYYFVYQVTPALVA